MSTESISTEKREGRGSQFSKHLRAAGKTPAVVYGHGEATINISVPTEEIVAAIRHGAHVVSLEGAVKDSAVAERTAMGCVGRPFVAR